MKVIRDRVESGAMAVIGTSAGTAVQSMPMITGGESWESLVDAPLTSPCTKKSCENDLQYDPKGGLGLFTSAILDTHFS